jgi:chemosensory pili system protein ChpA (sensor histidine kinase/response regulator)
MELQDMSMMHEAVDYNALSWVRQELDATLRQAHAMLMEYSGEEGRTELLHGCAELLHQVRGPLQIAELTGADLLVAEMEAVVSCFPFNGKTRHEKALEILVQSMQILPAYLSRLQSSADDAPELLLPQVNLLRSVQEGLHEGGAASGLPLHAALPEGVFTGRAAGSAEEIAARAHSARVKFQSALLAWYRGDAGKQGTAALVDVLGQLQEDAGCELEAQLWWVAAGVAEALSAGHLSDSREIKQLFGRVDRQIKRLVEGCNVDFGDAQAQGLLNDLLECISGIEADEGRLAVIVSAFRHDALDSDHEVNYVGCMVDIDTESRESSTSNATNPETGKQFQEILKYISLGKEAIDDYLKVAGECAPLSSVSVVLDSVYGALGSAGLDREANVIASVQAFLCSETLEPGHDRDEGQLAHLADAICSVEFYLECLRDGRIFGSRIIESAEASVAALGYPVPNHPALDTGHTGTGVEAVPANTAKDETEVACDATAMVSVLQVIDPAADKEILEIFLEESSAGLQSLHQLVLRLYTGDVSGELLEEISRVFHTFKGNGRMLGAQALGEFANAFEDLVNSSLVGSVPVDSVFTELLKHSCEAMSQLVDQVKDTTCKPGMDIDALVSEAVRMSHSVADGLLTESSAAEPEVVAACVEENSVSNNVDSEFPVLAAEADPEIVEIFIDEAGEEVAILAEIIPAWIEAPEQPDRITEIRRILHTLKGSGRMAGALFMGEFAWAMEDLFNRVIDGSVNPDRSFYALVEKLPFTLKQLIEQITGGPEPDLDIRALMTEAAELRNRVGDAGLALESGKVEVSSVAGTGFVTASPESDYSLLQIYTRESQDILDTIRTYLEDNSEGGRVTEPLYRGLHTLAGISESAEIGCVGRLASELDGYFSSLYHMETRAPSAALDVLRDSIDVIAHQIEEIPGESGNASEIEYLCDRISALHVNTGGAEEADYAGAESSLAGTQDMQQGEAPVSVDGDDGNNNKEHEEDCFASIDQELFEIFEEEAAEILDASERVLQAWAAEPGNDDSLVEYQRNLHTLKGSARMMNITAIGDLSHLLETVLTRVVENTLEPSTSLFSALFVAQDQLTEMLEQVRIRRMPDASPDLEAMLEKLLQIPSADPEFDIDPGIPEDIGMTGDAASVDGDRDAAIDAAEDTEIFPVVDREDTGSDVLAACAVTEAGNDSLDPEDPFVSMPGQHAMAEEPVTSAVTTGAEQASRVMEECPIPLRTSGGSWAARRQKPVRKRGEMVKVQSGLLDDLVNYSGEINIYRSRMESQIGDYRFNLGELEQTITRLREQLRKLEMETEAQVLYRYAQESDRQNQEFDPLELDRYSILQESSRSLMESISDLYSLHSLMENTTRDSETLLLQQSRVSTDLHEGLMRTRMTPFAGLETRLKRIVRQSARQLDKKVELRLRGADGEMDRAVIERIIAPLEHMLRNAVAHGIERPGERLNVGKEETGGITIAFDREGPDIVLRISDDGAGMDVEAIRAKAVETGLLDHESEISDNDVMQFVLQTGFTTASEVTQISGRGVGLDVVNSEVKQLGGSLHIASERGAGTIFTIRLPYTLAINQVLLVKAGADTYCVPLGSVEGVVRVHPEELLANYATPEPVYEYAGNQYQLKHLATLLNTDQLDASQMSSRVPLLLMRVVDKRIALHVESLLGSREIVIKPVGMQLSCIDGISGATILGDGSVAMILDVFALSRGAARAQTPVMKLVSRDEKRLVVMVVDDSITVRKVTTRLLERNGYKVLTAKDGVDATGQLQGCTPDIMLLDIEMPRMDGFELATHMRNDERLRHVPVIMITSRTGDKHRERARQIGVNHYLGKPYQENDLLDTIDRIIRVAPDSYAMVHAEA